jgi:hypothetical protein
MHGGRQTAGTSLARQRHAVGDDDESTHEASSQGCDRRIAIMMIPSIE